MRLPCLPRARTGRATATVVVVVLCAPPFANAQTASGLPPRDSLAAALDREARASACVRAIPRSAYVRVPVLVYGEVADSLDRAARMSVDLAAQAVARNVRLALWGSGAALARADSAGRLPSADSLFEERALEGGVRLVARRGGAVTWRPVVPPGAERADSAAALLLADAVGVTRGAGDLLVPDAFLRGDSLVFYLEHVRPYSAAGGERHLVTRRNPAPAFELGVPPEKQAGLNGRLSVRYPSELQSRGFVGKVIVRFVVDTAGRAEMSTLRDAYPAEAASLDRTKRGAYDLFLGAVRGAVQEARFFPADVGGCPVRRLVQLPVTFSLRR